MKMEKFIVEAGGIYENTRDYKRINKRENFWNFFNEPESDYAKSIYAGIDVDLMYKQKKHSIEHIVPKKILRDYLIEG